MTDMRYFGRYADFKTSSKKKGVAITGADFIIGDFFTIDFRHENRTTTAWIVNKFGDDLGFLDQNTTDQLDIFRARGWSIRCQLVEVLYTNTTEGGHYWGRVALVANEKRYDDAIDTYTKKLATFFSEDIRPVIDLSEAGVDSLIKNKGDWVSNDHLPLEKLEKGTVKVKATQSFMDKMVEAGRARKPGCYVISWIFIIVVVILIGWGLNSLFHLF